MAESRLTLELLVVIGVLHRRAHATVSRVQDDLKIKHQHVLYGRVRVLKLAGLIKKLPVDEVPGCQYALTAKGLDLAERFCAIRLANNYPLPMLSELKNSPSLAHASREKDRPQSSAST